jgi:hypothetical protein
MSWPIRGLPGEQYPFGGVVVGDGDIVKRLDTGIDEGTSIKCRVPRDIVPPTGRPNHASGFGQRRGVQRRTTPVTEWDFLGSKDYPHGAELGARL